LDESSEEMALLLMENCSNHIVSDVVAHLTEARMSVIILTRHTTQIFQVLDVTLFGSLERHRRYELPFGEEKATATFIIKVYHDFKQTIVEPNAWEPFQAVGLKFEFDTRSEPYRLLFNEEKLRESAGFRE
jgi:hypothetical protein